MTEAELTWLGERAAEHDVIVEMGCYQGRSTRIMGENTKGVVYAWDNWEGPQEDWWRNSTSEAFRKSLFGKFSSHLSDLIESRKVIVVVGSHDNLAIRASLPLPGMVFIDGDHTYEGASRDIKSWLGTGALLCGHDFNQESVARAVRDLLPKATNPAGTIWSCQL